MSNETDRASAILAALPLFLFGLLIAGITVFLMVIGGPSQIGADFPWHNLAIAVSVISLFALIYAAIAAIRNRLALWSYTWVGATVVGLVVSLNLVLDDRVFAFSKGVDIAIIVVVLLSCLVVFCRVALVGWQHTGLFSIGLCGVRAIRLPETGHSPGDGRQRS